MAEIRSIVNQVLSQLGTSREARYYLKQYSEDDLQFAVINRCIRIPQSLKPEVSLCLRCGSIGRF